MDQQPQPDSPAPIADAIATVAAAVDRFTLAEVARRAGVPYCTARDHLNVGFRPRQVANLEKLHGAALELVGAEG